LKNRKQAFEDSLSSTKAALEDALSPAVALRFFAPQKQWTA